MVELCQCARCLEAKQSGAIIMGELSDRDRDELAALLSNPKSYGKLVVLGKPVDPYLYARHARQRAWTAGIVVGALMLALGTLLGSLLPGCAEVQRAWPAFIECAMSGQVDLVQDVKRALLRDGDADELGAQSKSALDSLAKMWGADVIACIIEQLIDTWLAPGRSAIPHAESQAARRAQLFLSEHNSHPVMLED